MVGLFWVVVVSGGWWKVYFGWRCVVVSFSLMMVGGGR